MEIKCNKNILENCQLIYERFAYTTVARRASPSSTNKETDKYKVLLEKLIQLAQSDWPKFQEQLRKMHSAKRKQNILKQIFLQSQKIFIEKPITPTKTNAAKGKSHRSPINLPTSKIDNSGKAHISNPESNNEKIKNFTIQI